MASQIYYEDVAVGNEVPQLVKNPTTRQLVQWAAGSGDYYEIHYDQEAAHKNGLPGVIVHGKLKTAFLTQMVTDWIGKEGKVRKLSVRYQGMDYPNQQLTCRGKVTAKYERNGEHCVECEVWTENQEGQKTTTGALTVALPSRR
ncbi:MAG: dehydratase [Chloroflexota bacterium]|nr:MAG: dehydratase [Chloroflexota bacterium]